ncbi:hypothetical protein HMI54_015840 [Coelomomyces lativittatus]|nr:hypothetical protein HMI55_003454 [Coelomomyces lativittatus]KAJ1512221.1 hypothetical protein HMI54_015840 [Coelomomyces lativittatus]
MFVIIAFKKFPDSEITCTATIHEHQFGVTSLAYHKGSIFSGSHHGIIKVFNETTCQLTSSIQGHSETVWALAVDDVHPRFYSTGKDARIKAWSTDTCALTTTPLWTLEGHKNKIYSLAHANDRLYSGSADATVRIWSVVDEPNCVTSIEAHQSCINALVVHSPWMLTASNDKTVKKWDLNTLQCTLTVHLDAEVLSAASHEHLIIASTYNATMGVYDDRLPSTSPIAHLFGHEWETWQLCLSYPYLFSGSFDHSIKKWDLRSFQCISTLNGHHGFVHAMCFGEKSLISGCADKKIKIWK